MYIVRILIALIVISPPAHAGWFQRFCEKHLIADDPYPFAECQTDNLITDYIEKNDPEILKELNLRLWQGAMTEHQKRRFLRHLKS